MLPPEENYANEIERLYRNGLNNTITFTFQVTERCNLACSYCYQIDKKETRMSFDTAKKVIDFIFREANKEDSVLSYSKNKAIIFDFIGGEPLLEIELISQIINYIEKTMLETDSPWLLFHRYSFSTNGTLYFEKDVQELFNKYNSLLSIGVTIDGCKEVHDKCRVFPDGSGSYDKALEAALEIKKRYDQKGTKITISPENIPFLSKGIINMLELGYQYVHGNCVFESGWSSKEALILYDEMVKISDYILENDLEDKCCVSLFNKDFFEPMDETDNQNWCGGTGKMLAVDYKGDFYPCIRYMPSSLGPLMRPLKIGNVDEGIYCTCKTCKILEDFEKITRRSQSTDECWNCKISKGCSWCSGYNYQCNGTANKRVTYICVMHKARAIANLYYWMREAKKKKIPCEFKNYSSQTEIIAIIGERRYKELWRC